MIAGVLVELVGKAVKVAPEQIGATALKVGITLVAGGLIVKHC